VGTPSRSRNKKATADRPTVLFICHNHPSVRPGGAEAYALELHRYFRASGEVDSVFLAKGGPPLSRSGRAHLGTYIAPIGNKPDEYFCFTEDWDYDWTFGTIRDDKRLYTKHLRAFLQAIQPDIVHLQHTMFFGYDMLREIKNTLPEAGIVYTLHEFMPICHRQGQMLRTTDDKPCMEESPRRCHECFPDVSEQTFYMRKRFIQSHLSLVDRFIAPSSFLGERYVDWGIPREKVQVEEYGRTLSLDAFAEEPRTKRDRFGFFGQLTPFKGLQVLLEAVTLLQGSAGDNRDPLLAILERATNQPSLYDTALDEESMALPRVRIHGANLDLQPGPFQNQIKEMLQQTRSTVTFVGEYELGDLARHIAEVDWVIVPSIWWENSPLVIQEAFHFGRPVICSDIGGMAEKVQHGVNGLHFRAGDASSLATAMKRAVGTPGLWDQLRQGIRPIYRMEDHATTLLALYRAIGGKAALSYVG
jgi:glycosyltransferase involved in cell wall biosynthesis